MPRSGTPEVVAQHPGGDDASVRAEAPYVGPLDLLGPSTDVVSTGIGLRDAS